MNWAEVETNANQYRSQLEARNQAQQAEIAEKVLEEAIKKERLLSEAGRIIENLKIVALLELIKNEIWGEGTVLEPERIPQARSVVCLLNSDPYTTLKPVGRSSNPLSLIEEKTSIGIHVTHRGDKPRVHVPLNWFSVPNEIPDVEELIRKSGTDAFYNLSPRPRHELGFDFEADSPDTFGAICEFLDGSKQIMERENGYPRQTRAWCEGVLKQFPTTFQSPGDTMSLKDQLRWVMDTRRKVPVFLRSPLATMFSWGSSN